MLTIKEFDGRNLILENRKRGGKVMTLYMLIEHKNIFMTLVEKNKKPFVLNSPIETKMFYDFFDGDINNLWKALSNFNHKMFEKSWLYDYSKTMGGKLADFRTDLSNRDILNMLYADFFIALPFNRTNNFWNITGLLQKELTLQELRQFGQLMGITYEQMLLENHVANKYDFIELFSGLYKTIGKVSLDDMRYFCDRLILWARRSYPFKSTMTNLRQIYDVFNYGWNTIQNNLSMQLGDVQVKDYIDYITSEQLMQPNFNKVVSRYDSFVGNVYQNNCVLIKFGIFPDNFDECEKFMYDFFAFKESSCQINIQYLRGLIQDRFKKIEIPIAITTPYGNTAKSNNAYTYNDAIYKINSDMYTTSACGKQYKILYPGSLDGFMMVYDRWFNLDNWQECMKTWIENKSMAVGVINDQNKFVGRICLTFDEAYGRMYVSSSDILFKEEETAIKEIVDNLQKVGATCL